MVLANYCNLFPNSSDQGMQMVDASSNQFTAVAPSYNSKTGYGYAMNCAAGMMYGYNALNNGYSWVDVGFGDTAESPGQYELAAPNNSATPKLTCIGGGQNNHSGVLTNRTFFDIYSNFRNDTSSNMIIKEVGYYGNLYGENSTHKCLLCRKVLDTPITIAPGESYSFNYRLKIKD